MSKDIWTQDREKQWEVPEKLVAVVLMKLITLMGYRLLTYGEYKFRLVTDEVFHKLPKSKYGDNE